MARAARAGSDLAVAIIDLDEFKLINDNLCHVSGDRALTAFARALSAGLRSYHTPTLSSMKDLLPLLEQAERGQAFAHRRRGDRG